MGSGSSSSVITSTNSQQTNSIGTATTSTTTTTTPSVATTASTNTTWNRMVNVIVPSDTINLFFEYWSSITGTSSILDQTHSHSHHHSPSLPDPDHSDISIRIIGNNTNANTSTTITNASTDSSHQADHHVNSGTENAPSLPPSSSFSRYDVQMIAGWVQQFLPFSLLLLLLFVRLHLHGICVMLWVVAVLYKSNDTIQKQTALKGDRKKSILIGLVAILVMHVASIYWWYRKEDLLYPLALLPPNTVPPFWHAIFIIGLNDAMVRQVAMVFKCVLLIMHCKKGSRPNDYRKQGQMLTLIEYLTILYRASLPAPVWYKFFLNREYGSFFSSLITGLYLTLKLTSVLGKVQLLLAALKALSRREMNYGCHATSEQVNAAGNLCAICQEKMQAPILLRCKHIFCEDCVSEWFERERTCPLCRALVKPAGIRSYSDGSTTLFFQLF